MNRARRGRAALRRIPALAGVLVLLGCTGPTKYQKRDAGEGYYDYESRPGVHVVTFDGNGQTPREVAITYWHRRAAEICGGTDRYEVLGMDVSGRKVFPSSPTAIHEYTLPRVEGLIRCK